VCLQTWPSNTRAPLEPIELKYTLQRVQIDLVDMRATPHNRYSWILFIKDHFSKFSFLYALRDKTIVGFAKCIAEWLVTVGIPKIIQCDNGKEFKGVLLILLKKYEIKILNRRPRNPQTQSLVEQAKDIMKTKLRFWLEEYEDQGWTDGLPNIVLAINHQSHTSLSGKMPYKVFFGRLPQWEDRVSPSQELQIDQVEDEILDALDMVALEAYDVADEENNTYFPDLSIDNLFANSSADKVCLYYQFCVLGN